MFDEKIILARLQNGEDAQTIADEIAAAINKANQMYKDQKAAEEAAKKQSEIQKKAEMDDILEQLGDWMHTYYGIEDAVDDVSADQVIELIESLMSYIDAIKDFENIFGLKMPAKPIGTKVIKSNTKPANADETINAFLNKMGW